MALIQGVRSYIRDVSQPLGEKLHLQVLSEFADTLVFATFFFFAVHGILSPAVSRVFFPIAYGKASKKTRNNWDAHVVSFIHAVLIVVLSSRCLNIPSLDADRAFGFHRGSSFVMALSCGYFIWDATEAIIHYTEIGFVLHGIACLSVFLLASRPFAQYYGVRFLFWEVSTIFLDIHWFLDKTGKTGSTLQLINGIVLLITFSTVRLLWGGIISYDFIKTVRDVHDQLPLLYIIVYGGGNILLNLLNWFWFTKMISALRKRFNSQPSNTNDHHLKANGHKSFEHKEC